MSLSNWKKKGKLFKNPFSSGNVSTRSLKASSINTHSRETSSINTQLTARPDAFTTINVVTEVKVASESATQTHLKSRSLFTRNAIPLGEAKVASESAAQVHLKSRSLSSRSDIPLGEAKVASESATQTRLKSRSLSIPNEIPQRPTSTRSRYSHITTTQSAEYRASGLIFTSFCDSPFLFSPYGLYLLFL